MSKPDLQVPHVLHFVFVDEVGGSLESLIAELHRQGHTSEVVAGAGQLQAALASHPTSVLVVDTEHRDNENLRLVHLARASARVPVIALTTSNPSLEGAIRALKARVDTYLVKPFELDDLLTDVAIALSERRSGFAEVTIQEGIEARTPSERPAGDLQQVRRLTRREYEVMQRVLVGDDVAAIGSVLYISPHTVRNHLKAIYRKLDVRSRVELVVRFGAFKHEPASLLFAS
jgi:DNA-binding NarL/FixJ family response regulator